MNGEGGVPFGGAPPVCIGAQTTIGVVGYDPQGCVRLVVGADLALVGRPLFLTSKGLAQQVRQQFAPSTLNLLKSGRWRGFGSRLDLHGREWWSGWVREGRGSPAPRV